MSRSTRPVHPGLMARTYAGPEVSEEVFAEQHQVAPVRIFVEDGVAAVYGTVASGVAREDADESFAELESDFKQRLEFSGSGGAFNLELVAVVEIELMQRAEDHEVDREPNWSAPIGVAAKHFSIGNSVFHECGCAKSSRF
jgi:hypothetical protein